MTESERDALRATWHQLSKRNAWALVADEEAFLDQAAAQVQQLSGDQPLGERLRVAVQQTYSTLLYRRFQARDEAAAQELWLTMVRLSVAAGWDQASAQELAQEAFARTLEHLPRISSPQGFLSYAIRILITVRRDYAKQRAATQPLVDHEGDPDEPAAPQDLASDVEQSILSATIVDLLRAALPNELERTVLMRTVLFGDHPRDVARNLGLPLHRTRIAKCRGLQRLRSHQQLMTLIEELTGVAMLQLSPTGDDDDA